MRNTLLFVIGVKPNKIGSMETFVRELASQMLDKKWTLVACFEDLPSPEANEFLALPNIIFESLPDQSTPSWRQVLQFTRIVLRHRPSVLIYAFNSILRPYPWIARLLLVRRIFYNDHSSRPPGFEDDV